MANYHVRPGGKTGPDGKSRKKKEKKDPLDKNSSVDQDFTEGRASAEKAGMLVNLERMDTTRDADMADPNSPNYVGKRSDEMKQVLGIMQQGLSGLSAPENQALREQAQKSLDTQYQTSLHQQQLSAARSGVRGGAATAQAQNLDQMRINAQGDMEQKNLVDNIAIQDKRRSEYANQVSGQEDKEFGRVKDATDRLNKDKLVNIDQSNAETASRVGAVAGMVGYGQSKKNTAREYKLAKQGMAKGYGYNRPTGGGSATQGLTDAVGKIIDNRYGPGTSAGV